MKSSKKKTRQLETPDLKKPLSEQEEARIKGGKTPSPGGPVPIPYPNKS